MIQVIEGFLSLHVRKGRPEERLPDIEIFVKGNQIIGCEPTPDLKHAVIYCPEPIGCIQVIETVYEVMHAVSLSYKQVTRK